MGNSFPEALSRTPSFLCCFALDILQQPILLFAMSDKSILLMSR
jgi:hypothetical protein